MPEITAPVQAKGMVHNLIAETAKALAGEFWEQMCTGNRRRGRLRAKTELMVNRFYRQWPHQEAFIQLRWPEFVDCARASLVILLDKPDPSNRMAAAKADIYDALRLDGLINPRKLSLEAAQAEVMQKLTPKR